MILVFILCHESFFFRPWLLFCKGWEWEHGFCNQNLGLHSDCREALKILMELS